MTTVISSLVSGHCAHRLCDPVFPPLCIASGFPVAGGRRVTGGKGTVQEAAAPAVALCRSDEVLGTRGTPRPTPPLPVLLCRPLCLQLLREFCPRGLARASPGAEGAAETHTPAGHASGYPCTASEQRRDLLPRQPRAVATRQLSIRSSGLSLPVFSASRTAGPTSACPSVSLQGLAGLHDCRGMCGSRQRRSRSSPYPLTPPDPLSLFIPLPPHAASDRSATPQVPLRGTQSKNPGCSEATSSGDSFPCWA